MVTLDKDYTPERIHDARRLFSTIQELPESRRLLCITTATAYIDGFLAGQGIKLDRQGTGNGKETAVTV